MVFLLADLPDANTTGTLDTDQSFIDAEAVPREGFYMELVGALALTVTGIALATMTPAQLQALRPGRTRSAEEKDEKPEPKPDPEPDPEASERRRQRRTSRTRQRR